MTRALSDPQQAVGEVAGHGKTLETALRGKISGDVRFDALSRTIYATDASIYEITPVGVVLPRTVEDVVSVVNECRSLGTPIVARGAGTGLAGGAVGTGVQLDLSRYMNRVLNVNPIGRTADVEPGVVLDELNAELSPHGLMFAPDVATASRATIGGMIANNSCGAHSVVYGRTVDHVAELTIVHADGRVATYGQVSADRERSEEGMAEIERALTQIRDANFDEILKRFPMILRSNGGYGLDRLGPPNVPVDVVKILCGSEGTLGIVVRAKLKLIPIPKHTGLVVLHFADLLEAVGATPATLRHAPAAVELIDRMIIDAGRRNAAIMSGCTFLRGEPDALLVVEFAGDDAGEVSAKVDAISREMEQSSGCVAAVRVVDADVQAAVWNLRRAGLGLLMSKPGDAQPIAFVEDSAVAPERLRQYIDRFAMILKGEDVRAGYYAHASVGCIHVRPIINLKSAAGVARMGRIADAVSDLALEFGGAMTGEHGDGIARSCWIEKMYGSNITAAFKEVKRLFDPDNLLNPNKIVDAYAMTEHLRFGPSFKSQEVKTHLDFSVHGGMAGLAGMCSGVGACRKRMEGTMCPSFVATDDETHTTRARANALRVALSNRGLLEGLDDPALAEVMDLCIACKACKTECPTGVDMARLKLEFLSRRNLTHGASRRSRLIADTPRRLALASKFPRLTNLLLQSRPARVFAEKRYGFDRRVPPPRLAHHTFRSWFRRHRQRRQGVAAPRGSIVYFVDTWTNYFTPEVGRAAVSLLERAGFDVVCPQTLCCGRPAMSQGLLVEAKQLAEFNVRRLSGWANRGIPIVGTEPSCILTLADEYPQLIRTAVAARVAEQSMMIETFLRRLLDAEPTALSFSQDRTSLRYHAHCHQKALVGSADAAALLRRVMGDGASEISSGCCGMAGAFGHEAEHYDVAKAMGEQRLFPAVRDRGEAKIAVSGFSCRKQIEHHTGAPVRHIIEHLADALS